MFYGGLIAAVVVALLYLRRHRLPLWTTTDVFAPGIALGHVVGRLGCLMAGCCFGRPTSVPWAITFRDPAALANVGTPLGVPLHPTQLYEAGAEALILVFLLAFERRGRPFPGRTFWSYMLLYGVSRFVIEFYRGDSRGMVFDVLSTSQFVSVILVPLSHRDARRCSAGARIRRGTRRRSGRPRERGPLRTRDTSRSTSSTTASASTASSRRSCPIDRDRSCQRLIKEGHVTGPVEGPAGEHAGEGRADVPHRRCPRPRPATAVAEDLPLTILYEDADLVVIDKAAGMVVHPAAGHSSGTW